MCFCAHLDVRTLLGLGPQVNKFEQVSSDDHQMSVAGGRYTGLMSGGGGDNCGYCTTVVTV